MARAFLIAVAALCVAGCGPNARKNFGMSEPEQSLEYSRSAFGSELTIRNPTNSALIIRGAKVDPTSKTLTIEYLEATSDASGVRAANVEQMRMNAQMFPLYTDLQRQFGDNAIGILKTIPEIIREVVPTLDKLIQVRGDVQMADIARKRAFSEAIGGVIGGKFTAELFNEAVKKIDPQLGADVLNAAKTLPMSFQGS